MNISGWNNVSIGSTIVLIIIGIIIHTFIFGARINKFHNKAIDMLDICLVKCGGGNMCKKYTSLRDDGYMNNAEKIKNDKNCVFLGWELSHFIAHIFLGYYYNIYYSLGISVGYEMFERIEYNCASYADLIINLCGFMVGAYFRN